jgi:MtN3 and saliva related transmembrane protein
MLITIIGLSAAALTSLSYIPQVKKALPPGSTDDLSSRTLAVLAAGLALWIGYGLLNGDFVIIIANAIGFALVATLLDLGIGIPAKASQTPWLAPRSRPAQTFSRDFSCIPSTSSDRFCPS